MIRIIKVSFSKFNFRVICVIIFYFVTFNVLICFYNTVSSQYRLYGQCRGPEKSDHKAGDNTCGTIIHYLIMLGLYSPIRL